MFQYVYTTNMIIVFDDVFEVHMRDTLDTAVCRIEWAADKYGFTKADVIDEETGEILITWVEEA